MAALIGCDRSSKQAPSTAPAITPVRLTLDWKPEPEFGGFYAAKINGDFARGNLDVDIKSAGEGAPTWQLVDTGKTDFATTAADQVLIAREQGADVVALFAVYQTFPQGIMVHAARGFTRIDDVFTHPGTLAAEDDTWLQFCRAKFPNSAVTITGYSGGVAAFLAKPTLSQQCFVTSEPILARQLHGDPQAFLIADLGYNPYTTVVITKRSMLTEHPDRVQAMVKACRSGWASYLKDPFSANAAMAALNHDMDAATFAAAAAAQRPLIDTGVAVGSMTGERWGALAKQLTELKVLTKPVDVSTAFVGTP